VHTESKIWDQLGSIEFRIVVNILLVVSIFSLALTTALVVTIILAVMIHLLK